jgi:hypothetical protein
MADGGSRTLKRIQEALREQGVDLDRLAGDAEVKVVCVPASLSGAVEEVARAQRGHVVMVRVDEHTSRSLDAWVETGAVKSRSEAAALFLKEGLRLRAAEIKELGSALGEVDRAKKKLREKARRVLGERGPGGKGGHE